MGGGGSQTEIVVDHLTENTDPEVVRSGQEEDVFLGVGNWIFQKRKR